jgi:hypothetical protein
MVKLTELTEHFGPKNPAFQAQALHLLRELWNEGCKYGMANPQGFAATLTQTLRVAPDDLMTGDVVTGIETGDYRMCESGLALTVTRKVA